VGADLGSEILKTAPAPIYSEFMRMMTNDPALREFTNSVTAESAARLPGAMSEAVSKGIDISPLQRALTDLSQAKK